MIYPSANPLHQMQVRYYYFHRQNTYMVFLTFIWQTIVKSLCNVILSTRPSRHLDFQTSLQKDWSSPNTITRISTYRDHSALFRVELPPYNMSYRVPLTYMYMYANPLFLVSLPNHIWSAASPKCIVIYVLVCMLHCSKPV